MSSSEVPQSNADFIKDLDSNKKQQILDKIVSDDHSLAYTIHVDSNFLEEVNKQIEDVFAKFCADRNMNLTVVSASDLRSAFTDRTVSNPDILYGETRIFRYISDILELKEMEESITITIDEAGEQAGQLRNDVIKANEDLFRQKIEENHRKIQELQQQMEGYSAESIEANIARQQQRLESQRKVLSERAIQKYRNDMQSRLATLEQEKRKLTAQNALYAQALGNAQLLGQNEAIINQYITAAEQDAVRMATSNDGRGLSSHQNEEVDYAKITKSTKRDSRALKWMVDGKGGIDPVAPEGTSAEKVRELKNLASIVNRIDLVEAVAFMDSHTNTIGSCTQFQWLQKLQQDFDGYTMKKRGINALFRSQKTAVMDFAKYYYDRYGSLRSGNESDPVDGFMFQLISGARVGLGPLDIYNNKRIIDVVKNNDDKEETFIRLLGDTNADGQIRGVGGKVQGRRERFDATGVFGTQILAAYQSAKLTLGVENPDTVEEILVKNLFSLVDARSPGIFGLGDMPQIAYIKTFAGALDYFADNPELFAILKQGVNASNEYLVQAFVYGAKYAEEHLQREQDRLASISRETAGGEEELLTPPEWNRAIEQQISPAYEKYLKDLLSGIEQEKQRLQQQILAEKDPVKLTELEAELSVLSSADFKKSMELLNDPDQQAKAKKGFRINLTGLLYQHYKYNHQEDRNALNIGANLTHRGFNEWLTKNTAAIIQNLSFSGGIGLDKQGNDYQAVAGVALSLSAAHGLWEGGTLIYAAGVGAGWNGSFAVGPFAAVGVEQQIFSGASGKRLDAKAAHYLGAIANWSLAGWGGNVYWRRDKLEGLENQAKKIEELVSGLIGGITELKNDESLTRQRIETMLEKRLPGEKGSLVSFSHDVYVALKPYESILKGGDDLAKKAVMDQLAYHMTTHWLNMNKAQLAQAPWQVSGAALGLFFVAHWKPMPTIGISLSKYTNLSYTDDVGSLGRMNEALARGYGHDVLKELSFGDMAKNLNTTLKQQYRTDASAPDFLESNPDKGWVKINKALLEKVNLHILPELKPFVAREGGDVLYVPSNIPVSFVSAVDSQKTQHHLILGSVGLANTDTILTSDFFKFGLYNESRFAQQLVGLGEALGSSETTRTVALDRKFLENSITRDSFLRKLKGALDAPEININSIKIDNIVDATFDLCLTFNGQQEVFTISFAELGSIKILDNSGKQPPTSNAIQFEKGVVVTGDIPQLKVEKMRWTEVVKRFDEPITPEPLEKSVTPEVLEYFRGWEASDMIINFRLRAPANFNAFYTHVEKGNYDEAANLFKIYLGSLGANAFSGLAAEKITAIKNAFAPNADRLKGNVDFIYAALSRVKKTQYKQFGAVSLEPADSWVDRQQRYMKQAKERLFATAVGLIDDSSFPSSMDKSALKLLVEKRIKEDESNFGAIKRIIGSQAPSWSNPSSLRDQLYIMLCDLGEIAETRNVGFKNLLRQERLPGDGNGRNPTNAINEIIAARNETISTLNFPFDHAKEWDGVGLVFAYNRGSNGNTGHHEKFVDRPLYIEKEEKNLSELKHPETKEYFLRNLAEYQQDSNVLAQVMGSINTRVEKDFGADHKITMSQIILHLTDPTKYPLKIKKDDQNYLNIELDTEFQFGFFADCINESILMGPIKINLTGQVKGFDYSKTKEGITNTFGTSQGGVYTNAASTTINAHVEKQTAVIGIGLAQEKSPGGGRTIVKDIEGESSTRLLDIDLTPEQLAELDRPVVDFTVESGGTTYVIAKTNNGNLIASSVGGDSQDYPAYIDGNGKLVIVIETGGSNIVSGGVSVDIEAPTPTSAKTPSPILNTVADYQVLNQASNRRSRRPSR